MRAKKKERAAKTKETKEKAERKAEALSKEQEKKAERKQKVRERTAKEKADKEEVKKKAEVKAKEAKIKAEEAAEKQKERDLKERKKKAEEKQQKRELREKRALELGKKAKEKAKKAEKASKETAKKKAEAAERERKMQCKKKKLKQERHIKSQYPKKISISYRGGWKFYGPPYSPLHLYTKGNICQLEGRLRKSKSCVPSRNKCCDIAKINDARCRPPKTLHFATNHDHKQVAIQVKKNGFVCVGEYQPNWVSLSGIMWTRSNYMMEESTALLEVAEGTGAQKKNTRRRSSNSLFWSGQIQGVNGWQQKQALISHKHGNLCVLAGQLQGQSWLKPRGSQDRVVAKLPANCRPAMRMMFSTYSMPNGRPLRVDVLPDGSVEAIDVHGRPLEPVVVLDGIVFSTVEGSKLKLNTGFTAWGKGYHSPQARAENGICHVQGLVKGNLLPRKVATLPEWCRPAKVLTFNAPNNRHVHRLDVLTNGEVWLKTQKRGGRDFVSLNDITFPIPFESAYGAIMNTPCK